MLSFDLVKEFNTVKGGQTCVTPLARLSRRMARTQKEETWYNEVKVRKTENCAGSFSSIIKSIRLRLQSAVALLIPSEDTYAH